MNKMVKIIGIIASIFTIIDVILKYLINFKTLKFFINPIIFLNTLEIVIIILLVIIIHYILPNKIKLHYNKKRANRFNQNWLEFKNIMIEYSNNRSNILQIKYSKVIKELQEDFSYFQSLMVKIKKEYSIHDTSLSLKNFQRCFSIKIIDEWDMEVRRQIPREIECFDDYTIELIEYFNRRKWD
jgi:hypothetical protein